MKRLCVFASGSGTDFQSVIDGVNTGKIDGEIVLLVASRPDIYAVERAKKNGIEVAVFRKKDYESAEKMYDALIPVLKEKGVELIILAGYLTVLTPNIVAAYRDKIINIHPSLIPKYCGDGYYGMRVHEAVIAAGEKESGATVPLRRRGHGHRENNRAEKGAGAFGRHSRNAAKARFGSRARASARRGGAALQGINRKQKKTINRRN